MLFEMEFVAAHTRLACLSHGNTAVTMFRPVTVPSALWAPTHQTSPCAEWLAAKARSRLHSVFCAGGPLENLLLVGSGEDKTCSPAPRVNTNTPLMPSVRHVKDSISSHQGVRDVRTMIDASGKGEKKWAQKLPAAVVRQLLLSCGLKPWKSYGKKKCMPHTWHMLQNARTHTFVGIINVNLWVTAHASAPELCDWLISRLGWCQDPSWRGGAESEV